MVLILGLIDNAVDAFLLDALHHPFYLLITLIIVVLDVVLKLRWAQIATVAIHDIFRFNLFKVLLTFDLDQIEPQWFSGYDFAILDTAIFRCLYVMFLELEENLEIKNLK